MFSFRRRCFTLLAPLSDRALKGSSQNDEAGIIGAIFEAIPRAEDSSSSLALALGRTIQRTVSVSKAIAST
jgi:hypothetical protein